MGNYNANMYKDGDIPREQWDILFGPSQGYSHYRSSEQGTCSSCQNKTGYWQVTVKSRGKFLCESCYAASRGRAPRLRDNTSIPA